MSFPTGRDMASVNPSQLLFLHIPKTAGTTLSHIVVKQFAGEKIFHIRDPKFTAAPVYSRHCGSEDDFIGLSDSQRAGFGCVLGHMHFGLHKHLPGPCTYLAMLRDPVERLLSQHAQFNRMVRRGEFRGQGSDGPQAPQATLSLEAFCQAKPQWLHNPQAQFLSDVDTDVLPPEDAPEDAPEEAQEEAQEETLERIKSDLRKHFCMVGTTDRFDHSMLILKRQMGWKDVSYVSKNISRKGDVVDRVDPNALEMIKENSWIDQQLYDFANTLLDEAIEAYGENFEADLDAYRKDLETEAARYKRTRWKRALGRVFSRFGLAQAGSPGVTL